MYYDPVTGKRMESMDGMGYLYTNLMESVLVPAGPDAGYPMPEYIAIPEDQPRAICSACSLDQKIWRFNARL